MAFSREYAHRPPIPTAEEIMEDFTAMKNKDFNDPVLTCISDNLLDIHEQVHKTDEEMSTYAAVEQKKQKQEITDTYNKVSQFLEQNKNLRQSVTSMNELSRELHAKKDNLMQLILNIKGNMQEK